MGQAAADQWLGRLAVVTGAASGIGRATTLALVQRGCRIVALDIDRQKLDQLVGAGASLPGALSAEILDVTNWRQVETVAQRVRRDLGVPDYLVANAGINPPSSGTAAIDEDFWDQVIDVNLKGIFATNRAFLPAMAAAGRGSVVNLASVSGVIGWGGTSAYSASKGGVIALTKYLAKEFAPHVRVNCVCPGSVRTPMVLNNLQRFAQPEARLAESAALHLLQRIAEPEEIADSILYLLSEQSSFVTGTALTVDGGLTAV